jgi:hypothetical protein
MDQVAWANANVTVGGDTTPYARGALLPEPTSPEEAAERSTLRLIGAIRSVEVVYTAEELAEQARARGQASAAREAALDVDPAAPLGQQVAGSAQSGPPTLVEPSGSPVVIGDEDLRSEHQRQQRDAQQRADQAQGKPPATNATKQAWVDHAVRQGADRDEAEGLTRDQLRERYRAPDETDTGPPTAMDQAGAAQFADKQAREQGSQAQAAQQQGQAAEKQGQAGQQQGQGSRPSGAKPGASG